MNHIWLASYPRSGNTLLRTILWHCFGLRTASIYPDDLGGNRLLGKMVGHIELSAGERFEKAELPLVKTHHPPADQNKAIYIVRDGRAATVSLWHFYNRKMAIKDIITGKHTSFTWSFHLELWNPLRRPNTLLLKYEDLLDDLPTVLDKVGDFIDRDVVAQTLPDRNDIVAIDGKWVRKDSDWRRDLTGRDLNLFHQVNKRMMSCFGYYLEKDKKKKEASREKETAIS